MAFHYDPFSNNNQDENNESTARKAVRAVGNTAKRKFAKKFAKKAVKLAATAVKKGIIALGKALLAFLGTLGLPVTLLIIGVIFLIIIITFVSSAIFSSGNDLTDEQQDLYNHIVEASNSTVNMSNPEQAPYKVPIELLATVIQLEALQDDDHYSLVTEFADLLAPNFIYSDQFNEWTETKTRTCKEGEGCEPWSDIKRKDNYVTKLTNVDYWQGYVTHTYTPYVTDWVETVKTEYVTEIETRTETYTDYETRIVEKIKYVPEQITIYEEKQVPKTIIVQVPIPRPPWFIPKKQVIYETVKVPKTITVIKEKLVKEEEKYPVQKEREVKVEVKKEVKHYTRTRHQRYKRSTSEVEDYTFLDSKLNSLGFGLNDKRLLEANYQFLDKPMNYIAWLEGNAGSGTGPAYYNPYPGMVVPGEGVPTQFMPYYLAAEAKYGTPWFILASVHAQETQFSTHPTMISSAGAEGHMQFMPCTWVGWAYPGCKGSLGNAYIPESVKYNPSQIKKYGGYGVDANGDGIASPWDIEDAIHTAAKYLANNGVLKDPRKAVLAYNHAGWYADEVLARASRFQSQATYQPGDDAIARVIEAATSWLSKSNRYVFGGGRNSNDISRGHFDCSSFVHWAFKQAGIDLGPLHSVSTETLNKTGRKVNFSDIQPGDIIFFDTYKKDGHVGIWLGNGKWIGTQSSTGIAIVDQNTNSYWQSVFSGHVRRVN